ncbi:hypothetical protein [Priestia abyssalis]|uniref:hypothetical protein n=1 Tax=Priestia abyssalis TaxID=1221450 RepID=UPI0009959BEE|nr:hypothetical protein [Priestia abyssalis]
MNPAIERLAILGAGTMGHSIAISSYLFKDLSVHQESLSKTRELVNKGNYGQKTGKGLYHWYREQSQAMNEARERELVYWLKKDLDLQGIKTTT